MSDIGEAKLNFLVAQHCAKMDVISVWGAKECAGYTISVQGVETEGPDFLRSPKNILTLLERFPGCTCTRARAKADTHFDDTKPLLWEVSIYLGRDGNTGRPSYATAQDQSFEWAACIALLKERDVDVDLEQFL